jgi:anti-anti-sigma regulatory factor
VQITYPDEDLQQRIANRDQDKLIIDLEDVANVSEAGIQRDKR